jgi:hypothetical protein
MITYEEQKAALNTSHMVSCLQIHPFLYTLENSVSTLSNLIKSYSDIENQALALCVDGTHGQFPNIFPQD